MKKIREEVDAEKIKSFLKGKVVQVDSELEQKEKKRSYR